MSKVKDKERILKQQEKSNVLFTGEMPLGHQILKQKLCKPEGSSMTYSKSR